jgi:hypothetical protein
MKYEIFSMVRMSEGDRNREGERGGDT